MDHDARFYKYHALGNDYIVIDPADAGPSPTIGADEVRAICHRNFGVGSDGVLYGPVDAPGGAFGLRIFNPDGSEAEKSGNGLRIFARYLWDRERVSESPFAIHTAGGEVTARVHPGGRLIDVDMGRVSFASADIPVTGPAREVIGETLIAGGDELVFCAATVGNPHCVIVRDDISEQLARRWGPEIETSPLFPRRTNVQLMKIRDRNNIAIEIWERGAGYTLASGSSSSAAAAVARKLGHCDADITVHMPGGTLAVHVADDYAISIRGPVTRVSQGRMFAELFE